MEHASSRQGGNLWQVGFWRSHWKEAILLVALVFILYGQSITFEFVLDDQIVITENEFTKQGFAGIPKILTTDSSRGYSDGQASVISGARYRPLSLVIFAAEYALFGPSSAAFHLIGVVFYALTGLLLFRVMALLFGGPSSGAPFVTTAFLTAVLYVTHPVHTEVVANVKGLDETLAMLGAMGALYGVLRYLDRGSRTWWALSGVCLLLGLLAKENAITWLAVIPLVLLFFRRVDLLGTFVALAPSLSATAVYLAIRSMAVGSLFGKGAPVTDLLNNPFVDMSFGERYATIVYTLGLYVKLLFLPYPLTHDYFPYHIPIMHWASVASILSLALYVGMVVYAFLATRRKRIGAFCVFYFLVTISLVSNLFFPIGSFMSERFLFMPSLAFCIGVAYLVAEKIYPRSRAAGWAVALVIVLGFGLTTVKRNPAWANPLSLARSGVEVSQNSAKATCALAIELYDLSRQTEDVTVKKASLDEAELLLDRSLEIFPTYRLAIQVKSAVLAEQYVLDEDLDKLLLGFEDALERDPDVEYIQRYAAYLRQLGRDRPRLLDFYYRVGYEILALGKNRHELALRYLGFGLALDRDDARLNLAVGKTYEAMGEESKAEEYFARAYQSDPSLRDR